MRLANSTQAPINRERGGAIWAFVLTLLALFVFAYMWWDTTDQLDKARQETKAATERMNKTKVFAQDLAGKVGELSRVVGYQTEVAGEPLTGVNSYVISDITKVAANLTPDGVIQAEGGTTDGLVNWITKNALVVIKRDKVVKADGTPDPGEVKWLAITPEFQEAVEQVGGLTAPQRPGEPKDWAHPDEKAQYDEAMRTYEQELEEYHNKIKQLSEMPGFKEWTLKMAGEDAFDINEDTIQLLWVPRLDNQTVQDLMQQMRGVITGLVNQAKKANEDTRSSVKTMREQNTALQTETKNAQDALEKEQTDHENTRSTLEAQIDQIKREKEQFRLEALKKSQALDEERKRREADVAKLSTQLAGQVEALRILKQKRDLIIRRDDPDGEVLAANMAMRTAFIDKGSRDKVYVGLKFNVSALDRVGDRVQKGEIMVIKVTGPHSASCRIVSATGPITRGDIIHNPFFNAADGINIWFAGKITKWPKEVAVGRLNAMGVTVQDRPSGKTDYIVVPDAWALAKNKSGDEDEDEDEEEDAKDPMTEVRKLARKNGATIIVERLLDAFLDY